MHELAKNRPNSDGEQLANEKMSIPNECISFAGNMCQFSGRISKPPARSDGSNNVQTNFGKVVGCSRACVRLRVRIEIVRPVAAAAAAIVDSTAPCVCACETLFLTIIMLAAASRSEAKRVCVPGKTKHARVHIGQIRETRLVA